ncbi:MAG: bacterial Ig-like domain-containing protein [Lachnospiraceae bacterium]|nr:bacterial Ig-like domain-containing protein [Lachnospiraceae bacterium]
MKKKCYVSVSVITVFLMVFLNVMPALADETVPSPDSSVSSDSISQERISSGGISSDEIPSDSISEDTISSDDVLPDIVTPESMSPSENATEEAAESADPFKDGEVLGYAVPLPEGEEAQQTSSKIHYNSGDQDKVHDKIMAMKSKYPEGMEWTNSNYYEWKGGIYTGGYGCAGFAFLLSDAAFDDAPARMIENVTFSSVRVGDILRVNGNTHSVIITEVNSDSVTLAEGNYNSSIHWGRTMTASEVNKSDYMLTRYDDDSGESRITLKITKYPKQEYVIGEKLDLTGGEITALKPGQSEADGEVIAMTDPKVKVDSSKFNSEKPGKYSITLKYKEASVSFKVEVKVDQKNATVVVSGNDSGGKEHSGYFISVADALSSLKNSDGEYEISVLAATNETKKLSVPSAPKSVSIIAKTESAVIRISETAVITRGDLKLNCRIENKKNKSISLKPAAGSKLTIEKASDNIRTITAKKGSAVNILTDMSLKNLTCPGTLAIADGCELTMVNKGTLNLTGTCTGKIKVTSTKKALIKKADAVELVLVSNEGVIPKLTLGSVDRTLSLTIVDGSGNVPDLLSGTKVLNAKKTPDADAEKINIVNTNGGEVLKAFVYGKKILAENPETLTLDGKNYPGFEKAFMVIAADSSGTSHEIRLNRDTVLSKWKFPVNTGVITIDGQSHNVRINGFTGILPKSPLEMKNINLTVRSVNDEPAGFTVKSKKSVTLEKVSADAKSFSIVGDPGSGLIIRDCSKITKINGFGKAELTGEISISRRCTVRELELSGDTTLTMLPGSGFTVRRFAASGNPHLVLKEGFGLLKIGGSAEGKAELELDDAIREGSRIFVSKIRDLNGVFSVKASLGTGALKKCVLVTKKGNVYVVSAEE